MNRTYDIVIAGGGVIGASCAYQLSRRGNLRIAVVDDSDRATPPAPRPAASGPSANRWGWAAG